MINETRARGRRTYVESDGAVVANSLHLSSVDTLRLEIPQHEMVLSATGGEGVSILGDELVSESLSVLANLLGIGLECLSIHFLELSGDAGDLVDVRTTLQTRKHGIGDLGFEVAFILAVEDHTSARSAEGLVCGGGHDVAVGEGTHGFSGGNEAGDVGHVHHEEGAILISNGAVLDVVPLARVGRASADDECGLEQRRLRLQGLVVDDPSDRVHAVRERLEVHRGGRDSLTSVLSLGVGVEAVSEVSSRRKVKTHDAVVGTQQSSVHSEVSRGSGVRLDVNTPFGRIESICFKCSVHAQSLDLIDELIATIVALARISFCILVGEGRAEAFHHSLGSLKAYVRLLCMQSKDIYSPDSHWL